MSDEPEQPQPPKDTGPKNLEKLFQTMVGAIQKAQKSPPIQLRKKGEPPPKFWCPICGITHTPALILTGDTGMSKKNCDKCQLTLDEGYIALICEDKPPRYAFVLCDGLVNSEAKTTEERQIIKISAAVMDKVVAKFNGKIQFTQTRQPQEPTNPDEFGN